MNLNQSLRNRPVAVIGMSAMFADAINLEEFWNNIIQAKDSVTEVPESRWRMMTTMIPIQPKQTKHIVNEVDSA